MKKSRKKEERKIKSLRRVARLTALFFETRGKNTDAMFRATDKPQTDDPSKTKGSFGKPKEYFNELLKSIANPWIIKNK